MCRCEIVPLRSLSVQTGPAGSTGPTVRIESRRRVDARDPRLPRIDLFLKFGLCSSQACSNRKVRIRRSQAASLCLACKIVVVRSIASLQTHFPPAPSGGTGRRPSPAFPYLDPSERHIERPRGAPGRPSADMNPLGQLGTRVATQLAVASPAATTAAATATRVSSRSPVSHSHSARPLSTTTATRTVVARKQPRAATNPLQRTEGKKLPFASPAQSRSGIHSAAWARNIGGEGRARSFSSLSASVGLSSAPGWMPVGSVSGALALVHPRFHSTHRVARDTSSSFSE